MPDIDGDETGAYDGVYLNRFVQSAYVPGSIFKGTEEQKWLHRHCWEYGFVIRYQEDKEKITGYLAECWHVRYVGLPYSLDMLDRNQCLEEYLGVV